MSAFRTSHATVSAHGAVPIVPSDSAVIQITRGIFVGGAGNINLRTADGQTVLFTGVNTGIFPIQVDQVLATGTTATNLVALY